MQASQMLSLLLLGQQLQRPKGPAGSCKVTRGAAGSHHPGRESRQMGRPESVSCTDTNQAVACVRVCRAGVCREGLDHQNRRGLGGIPFAKQPRPVSS